MRHISSGDRFCAKAVVIEALEDRRLLAGFAALIDFQPPGVPTQAGYQADTGAVFGLRGNDLSYGWNATNNTGVDRNSKKSPNQAYDTFLHMQKGAPQGGFTWELAVPNGAYDVRIVAGDPSNTNAFYHILAEGQAAIFARPSSSQLWIDRTTSLNVTDGRLTIGNGESALNNKISFIEVRAVEVPIPPPPPVGSVPAAPSGLAFSIDNSQPSASLVTLTWADNADNEERFIIEQQGGFFFNFFPIKEVPANTTSTTIAVGLGLTVQFRVRAANSAGNSAPSNAVTVTTRPAPPDRVFATAISSTAIDLNWNSPAPQFKVQRLDSGVWNTIAQVTTRTYRDENLPPISTHSYRIIAVSSSGESDPSIVVSATTAPAKPTGLMVTNTTSTSVSLSWNDVEGEMGFFIERSLDGINWDIVGNTGANVTTFTDSGLTSSTTYFYRVRGFINVGFTRGDPSDPITATTLS